MKRIRKWFYFPSPLLTHKSTHKDDVLIYIRLGDYYDVGMTLKYAYYEAAIQLARPRRIFIVTEDKHHPFLKQFDAYSPIVVSRDTLSDLAIALAFRKIILSCSTFAWWAAILADPEEVYFPIAEAGQWSPWTMQYSNYQQDLRINDSKYTYFYNCVIVNSSRHHPGYVPLINAKPDSHDLKCFSKDALAFHTRSKAFWFV